tara:strand:+ start:91 stop:225 length:135 start_codon:yes stop_codon:yes gene_type:complete
METIGKLIVPTIVIISVIVLGIMIYIDERKDAKRQLKDKESNNV